MTNGIIIKIENIQKSKYDDRFYRGSEFPNGLKALLISDPTTDTSAASLTVGAGSLNEPKELPGLAHFLEHMLFLGSKKYPEENAYEKFIRDHAGSANAFTTEDQTTFYFNIGPAHLIDALDRFAQFFIEPLFEDSAIQREINAVNSEYEISVPEDMTRVDRLMKSMSKAGHPYDNFGIGNKETLFTIPESQGTNMQEELLKFHNTWYSANLMTLVVFGKESLDELESIVTDLFGGVKNKSTNRAIYENHPYGPEELKHKCYVVPITDTRELKIHFATPDIKHQYRTAPDYYIANLIRHKGPASLYSVLRKLGLANALDCGLHTPAPGFGLFWFTIDLTEKGLDCVDEIITLFFQYIKLLKSEDIKKWIFEEDAKLRALFFSFKDKESPSSYVTDLSTIMQDYPFEDVLTTICLNNEWKPEIIRDLLSYLRPDNMHVIVMSKSFEDIADKNEKWYGTKYSIETISETLLQKWNEVELSPNLQLPQPNEFIPHNFDLYPLEKNAPAFPCIVRETKLSRIWFKQDDQYKLPKLNLKFLFYSSVTNSDPENINLFELFVDLLRDYLTESLYSAELAGVFWSISLYWEGLYLDLSGFNEKLPAVLKEIMNNITHFKIDSARFEIIKENYVRGLENFKTRQPINHAQHYLNSLLSEKAWTNEELLNACYVLDIPQMERFRTSLFSRMYIQGLIHGNINKEKCTEILDIVEAPFKSATPLLPQQLLQLREAKLEKGGQYIYEVSNGYHSSSCLYVYFQCGAESTLNNVVVELFDQITAESCFTILRTQEQLGYDVGSYFQRSSGMQGIVVYVQSEKHPVYLNSRVEEFLNSIKALMENMTEEEFEVHKCSLETKILEKPKNLGGLTHNYWTEIVSGQYNFGRDEIEAKELRTLQKEHILKFYEEFISNYSSHRRKLSVHVLSEVTNPEIPENIENKEIRIADVTVFKSSLGLCPLPKAYIDVPPLGTRSKL